MTTASNSRSQLAVTTAFACNCVSGKQGGANKHENTASGGDRFHIAVTTAVAHSGDDRFHAHSGDNRFHIGSSRESAAIVDIVVQVSVHLARVLHGVENVAASVWN